MRLLDEEPGDPKLWQRTAWADSAAQAGRSNPLVVPTERTKAAAMEERFGGLADAALARRGLVVDATSRRRLLEQVAAAMEEVSRINESKAYGDYSESGETDKYPDYVPKRQPMPQPQAQASEADEGLSFGEVIDEEFNRRAAGKDAKPMSVGAAKKYRRVDLPPKNRAIQNESLFS
ncbi:hypothetical protein [Maritimibacter sp. 55A14]|uniref:hypothetical protein n=1 Tax=Maritimibacter sp. 55A14 TaxID=2174844 RepID=UPI0011B1D865|nr:hypothetical protein [Maritimibacter sp. 55A14]